MGCDIHLHIEVKIEDRWEHYAVPKIERWYRLFGLMAGVRDHDIMPIVAPKGLPDDITVITKMHRNEFGKVGHADSWFNHSEIKELSETLMTWQREGNVGFPGYDLEWAILGCYFFDNSFAGNLPEGIEDIRFVFWFDN